MKRLYRYFTIIGFVAVVANMIACGKNDSGGQIALTPTSTCMQSNGMQGSCNPGVYTNQYGFSPYNAGQNGIYNNGFCGCAPGYLPTYNNGWGMGCVNANLMTNNVNYAMFGWFVGNNQWVNMPQNFYTGSTILPQNGNCFQQASMACDSRVVNSCGTNGYCRRIYGGEPLGLCVYSSTTLNNTVYGGSMGFGIGGGVYGY